MCDEGGDNAEEDDADDSVCDEGGDNAEEDDGDNSVCGEGGDNAEEDDMLIVFAMKATTMRKKTTC